MKRHLLFYACCIAAVTAAAASRTATEAYVTNRVTQATNALHEAIAPTIDYSTNNTTLVETIAAKAPAPDFTTSNTTLVATIEAKAPAPGNYAAVSNAAMSAAAATNDFLRLTGGTMTGNLVIDSTYVARKIINDGGIDGTAEIGVDSSGPYLYLDNGDALPELIRRVWFRNEFIDFNVGSQSYNVSYPSESGTLALQSDISTAATAATNYTDSATNALMTANGEAPTPAFEFDDGWYFYGQAQMASELWYGTHYHLFFDEGNNRWSVNVDGDVYTLAYVDEVASAIATADTTYRLTVGINNINQSVQYVNTSASITELAIQLPEGSGAKDWIVYVEAATNLTLTLPPATWWMADTAYTNSIPPATPTAFYFTTVTTNATPAIYMLSRQELQPVTVTEIAP